MLAGAASLGSGAFTPAHAVLAVDPSDFVFIESITGSTGTFTIINNSSDWYIWAFSVVTDATNPETTQLDWNAGPCSGGNCSLPGIVVPGSGVSYEQFTGAANLTVDIGPGESSNKFTFSLPVGSTPYFSVVNSLGSLTSFTPTGSIPEPSTWAMLIAGFGFLGWRYGLNRGGLRRIFRTA